MVATWKDKLPESVKTVLRPIYLTFKRSLSRIYAIGDQYMIIGPDRIYDEEYYEKRKMDPWRTDAHCVAEAINDRFCPKSVIDFGCAIGAHLELFQENGVEVKGVEGNKSAIEHSIIPSESIDHCDLRKPYKTDQKYDLVLCFEVAEHIPEKYVNEFLDSLTEAGDDVIMTAATPGQGGTHHVNEQPREYWISKFDERGFEYDESEVEALKGSIEVTETTWITENLFVFTRK